MKRYGHLFEQIVALSNIELADEKARKHKKHRYGIIKHDKNREKENIQLSEILLNGKYKTSKYKTFKIYEPKERVISRLPYYPDRITHHAILNVLEPLWVKTFVPNTYSCIKGRGISAAYWGIRKSLEDVNGTKYCLKVDIKKFYQSLDHGVLLNVLRKKIKDRRLLLLLKEIIDSNEQGVPIGNYLSQFFANLYLTEIDHKIKEILLIKHYHRYADDMVFLASTKKELVSILNWLMEALAELRLELKSNYQIFPVNVRGIDFVGYVFFHTHVLLRKTIKEKIRLLIKKYVDGRISFDKFKHSISAYYGWLQFCNSKHYLETVYKLVKFKLISWLGKKSIVSNFYKKFVKVVIVDKRQKYYKINLIYRNKPYSFKTTSKIWDNYLNCKNFNIILYETTIKKII